MTAVRRTLAFLVLAALTIGAAFAAGAVDRDALPWSAPAAATAEDPATPTPVAEPTETPDPTPEPEPTPMVEPVETPDPTPVVEPDETPDPTPVVEPDETPEPTPEPEPTPVVEPVETPGPRLLATGDRGDEVRDLQARLRQIRWFDHDVTGYYGEVTATAVRGFQAKRGFPVTGEVDRRTLDRVHEMTREPTRAELTNAPTTNQAGTLDPRCTSGRVLCIDKSSRTLRWVVDGQVRTTVDARFGRESMPTREGSFTVFRKSRDHVSSIYHTPMPYAMFFAGGQAVHYSPDFAATGYNGASHGCVNVRDRGAIAALFDQVRLGDRVVVYWS